MSRQDHEKYLEIFRTLPFFKNLDASVLDFIATNGKEKKYSEGQIIFQQGDPCEYVAIMLHGQVNLSFFSEDGKEVILSESKIGDLIGGPEITLNCPWITNASTTKESSLLTLNRASLAILLTKPDFAKALLTILSLNLRETMVFAENMAIHTLETRLARWLLAMSQTHGKPVENGIQIDRSIPQGRIGQMINASRPKINAQLRAWQGEKLIRLDDSRITILDQKALRSLTRCE